MASLSLTQKLLLTIDQIMAFIVPTMFNRELFPARRFVLFKYGFSIASFSFITLYSKPIKNWEILTLVSFFASFLTHFIIFSPKNSKEIYDNIIFQMNTNSSYVQPFYQKYKCFDRNSCTDGIHRFTMIYFVYPFLYSIVRIVGYALCFLFD